MNDRYFDSAGVRLRYVERGQGEPVVLVHSYTSSLDEQWVASGILDRIAERYRAIAFDLRGHGKSDKPHEPAAYGAEMAWDIVRLLDHLSIAKAHVVGYSMGANVVSQLLTLAPQRVKSATLGGAAGRLRWSPREEAQAELEAAEMECGVLDAQLLRLRPAREPRPRIDELRAMAAKILAGKDRLALAAIRRSNKAQVVGMDALAAVRVPVLGVVGSADPYSRDFDALKRVMPQLEMEVISGATHHSAAGSPRFTQAILDFLERSTRAGVARRENEDSAR
jgi:pimeloyl-ACP methyl ester carboxylesterase